MIVEVDVEFGVFDQPWDRFRDAVWESMGEDGTHEQFWKIAYEWAKVYDVTEADNLVRFESGEDASAFLLSW